MYERVHPWRTSLHGDNGYNPRDVQVWDCGFGLQWLTGVLRDDGRLQDGLRPRPDRSFRFLIPIDVDWRAVSLAAFYRLRDGQPIDLDFRFCRQPGWAV